MVVVSSEWDQRLGGSGSRNREIAQTTNMLLVHTQLDMEEG
jgi:hypothetical protein